MMVCLCLFHIYICSKKHITEPFLQPDKQDLLNLATSVLLDLASYSYYAWPGPCTGVTLGCNQNINSYRFRNLLVQLMRLRTHQNAPKQARY